MKVVNCNTGQVLDLPDQLANTLIKANICKEIKKEIEVKIIKKVKNEKGN